MKKDLMIRAEDPSTRRKSSIVKLGKEKIPKLCIILEKKKNQPVTCHHPTQNFAPIPFSDIASSPVSTEEIKSPLIYVQDKRGKNESQRQEFEVLHNTTKQVGETLISAS